MGLVKEGAKWAAKSLIATAVVEGGKKVAKEAANTYIKKQGKQAGQNLAIKLARKAGLVEQEPEKSDVEKALDIGSNLAKKAFSKAKNAVSDEAPTEETTVETPANDDTGVTASFAEQAEKASATANEVIETAKKKTAGIGKVAGAFVNGLKNSK